MCSPQTNVCVLTARGMAAISSVALVGSEARAILEKVFRAGTGTANQSLTVAPEGMIIYGTIVDGERVIDEVLVGCEGADTFTVHCHGNPLLTEQVIKLLQSHGAVLVDSDSFASMMHKATSGNTIEVEARLAMQKSATVLGVKILQVQIDGGLSAWAKETLESIHSLDTEELKRQCSEILECGKIAQRIIDGVRIVIAGPPNSGKSTLFNCLAGQEQVIVSDTAGTTRDWVSVTACLADGILRAEFIDTAGLDGALAGKDDIEQTAQAITKKLLESCELILYVQDVTQQVVGSMQWAEVPVVYVDNKCDLVQEPKNIGTQGHESVPISAQNNIGIDELVRKILERLEVVDFDATKPITFTHRQRDLLSAVINTDQQPENILSELLNSEDCLL